MDKPTVAASLVLNLERVLAKFETYDPLGSTGSVFDRAVYIEV